MSEVLLLSNMYPSAEAPSFGIFVKHFEDQLIEENISYDKIVMYKSQGKINKLFSYLSYFFKVVLTLLFKEYEIIYIHYASITSIPVLVLSKLKKFTIYTNVHGTDLVPSSKLEKKLEGNTRKVCEISEKIIVPSNYFKKLVTEKYELSDTSIVVYPSGGINETIFYPMSTDYSSIEKEDKVFTLGFVSRIEKEKGWSTFVDAISKLLKEQKELPIKIIIVGDGRDRELMKESVKELNLEEHFKYYPLVDQSKLNEIFNEMDIFIFPTRKESLGLVGIEALSCGIPVIASNIEPLTDYIIPYQNGLLFEKDNAKDLKDKIAYMLSLPEAEFIKLKEQARQSSFQFASTNQKEIFKSIFNL